MVINMEEELNINAPSDPISKKQAQDQQSEEDHANRMDGKVGDLSDVAAPGQTNEEFIHRLLQVPSDRLIPWEECWLPSKGIYYGWPDGLVKVKAMGQVAEKILSTQRLAQTGQSIDYLFRECCQFPNGFDPVDLLLGDRIFMLYFIRGITHGNMYEFVITCPNVNCEAVSTHTYDLNDLAQTINWAKPELGREPFQVDLPYISAATKRRVWVGVRFLRASDASDILAKRKTRKKMFAKPGGVRTRSRSGQQSVDPRQQAEQNQMLDDTISHNMEKIIVNVLGINDLFTVRDFISKMHAQDTAAVREWLRENTPGIDNTVTVTCPECSNEFTVELPITDSFFRPSKS